MFITTLLHQHFKFFLTTGTTRMWPFIFNFLKTNPYNEYIESLGKTNQHTLTDQKQGRIISGVRLYESSGEAYEDLDKYLRSLPKLIPTTLFYLQPRENRSGEASDPQIWYKSQRVGEGMLQT